MSNDKSEEVLDSLLDRLLLGTLDNDLLRSLPQEAAASILPQLEAALWLQTHRQRLAPRSSFAQATWNSLKSRITHDSKSPSFWLKAQQFWVHSFLRRVLIPAAIVMIIVVILIGPTVVSATQEALPGDTLYSVKISIENLRLQFTQSKEEEIRLLSDYATERLREAELAVKSTRIEDFEFALRAYQDTTSRYLDMLGSIGMQDKTQLSETLDQTTLEQVKLLEALIETVISLDSAKQPQVQGILDTSLANANALQEWLARDNPANNPPIINTLSPTPRPTYQIQETPTSRWINPSMTATPGPRRGTFTPLPERTARWPSSSATPKFDMTGPSYGSPAASGTPTPTVVGSN